MSSELISIGRPLTPVAQDDLWVEQQQQDTRMQDETPRTPPAQATTSVLDDDNYMEQTTPSPKASQAFRRLRKGLRPQVSMTSIPEEDVQHHSSVARQVFPEATPSASSSESEAKAAEDIPAASAEEEKEEEKEDDREAIPPTSDPVIQENLIVPNPLVVE